MSWLCSSRLSTAIHDNRYARRSGREPTSIHWIVPLTVRKFRAYQNYAHPFFTTLPPLAQSSASRGRICGGNCFFPFSLQLT